MCIYMIGYIIPALSTKKPRSNEYTKHPYFGF